MNTTDFNGKQYTMKDNGDGSITLVPVVVKAADLDWVPSQGYGDFWYVDGEGDVTKDNWAGMKQDIKKNLYNNIFPTEAQAKKAAEYMRRSNAIIRACLLVDPDYVPDWKNPDQVKCFPCYHVRDGWYVDYWYTRKCAPAQVSTREKCEQVCALLTKWGVK